MLNYNEIKPKKVIIFRDEPYEVIDSHVFRKQQRKPVNVTKLKNLITGKVIENSFHQSEKIKEAEIINQPVKYLYRHQGEIWLSEIDNPKNRFKIDEKIASKAIDFVKENTEITALIFKEEIIGLNYPIKTELMVEEAPPSTRGNTAQGGVKQVVLETKAVITVPLFINEGDIIRVNTETGEYVERV